MAWWTWLSIGYSLIVLLLFRPMFTALIEGEKIREWGDFWLSVGAALILSCAFPIWLPFYLIHRGGSLLLGDHPGKAASKLSTNLHYTPDGTLTKPNLKQLTSSSQK